MVNLDYQERFKDFRQECIKYLQKIFPSKDDYEAGQKYAELSEIIEKRPAFAVFACGINAIVNIKVKTIPLKRLEKILDILLLFCEINCII